MWFESVFFERELVDQLSKKPIETMVYEIPQIGIFFAIINNKRIKNK